MGIASESVKKPEAQADPGDSGDREQVKLDGQVWGSG
jgi:hypothetical protein